MENWYREAVAVQWKNDLSTNTVLVFCKVESKTSHSQLMQVVHDKKTNNVSKITVSLFRHDKQQWQCPKKYVFQTTPKDEQWPWRCDMIWQTILDASCYDQKSLVAHGWQPHKADNQGQWWGRRKATSTLKTIMS